MRSSGILGLTGLALITLLASSTLGASIFFSDSNDLEDPGIAPLDTITIPAGTSTIYIWSSDDQDYSTSIGLNVVSSAPDAVALSGSAVDNPDIIAEAFGGIPFDVRWESVSGGTVSDDTILDMNAVSVSNGAGILAQNDGTTTAVGLLDEGYNVAAGAFLLGSVEVTASGDPGAMSELSINQDDTVGFFDGSFRIFPEFIPVSLINDVAETLLGDVNLDDRVNGLDVDPFLEVVLHGPYQSEADMNEDQAVNGLDVDPFVSVLIGGGATQSIPEPSTLLLCLVALGALGAPGLHRARTAE